MKLLRSPALLCLVIGALAACGFAPLGLWPLTLACLAAWMLLVGRARSIRGALGRGYAFGVGHFTVNDNWFQHAFDFQDKMPPVLGYGAAVALALYLAVYPAAAAGVAWRFRNERRADLPFVLIFAAAWIATEWLRATLFTGYAWDPLGVMWVPVQPAAALAAWVGTYALSGLTIVLAGLALLAIRSRRRRSINSLVIVAVLLLLAQSLSYPHSDTTLDADTPRVRIVQPNIGNGDRGRDGGEKALAALIRGSGGPEGVPRLVVWPEGLLADFLEEGYPAYVYAGRDPSALRRRIAAVLGPHDVLMTSADTLVFDVADNVVGAGNSVLAINADARIVGRYDKAHLVPYGEYLPMPWLLRPLGLARLVPGDLDFTPGPGPRALPFPGVGPIGVQVCYEIVFSGEVVDRAHRPRLLFNPSNDAWFGRWGPPQHLAQARMRAIEEGLPIVRATPTGISAIIAADGRLLATVPPDTAGAIEAPFPAALPPTLFARAGNALAAIVGAALFAAGVAMRRRRRYHPI
jgi:apolipoprotein N-acyltransferase